MPLDPAILQQLTVIETATQAIRALDTLVVPPPVVVVIPPPVVPVPPPVATLPAHGTILIGDDMQGYSDTQALQKAISAKLTYRDVIYPELLSVDHSVLENGHQTLKFDQPPGKTPQTTIYLPHPVTEFWYTVSVRFSPGWTTQKANPLAPGSNAYKFIGWGWAGVDGRGTIEYTNLNQYTFNWNVIDKTGTRIGPVVEQNGPNASAEWKDGLFYDVAVHYQQTSPTTAVQSWYMGKQGTVPTLRATITGTMTKGTIPPCDRVLLGMNINQLLAKGQSFHIGSWAVYDGAQSPNPFGLSGLL